jgi:hypothetical protein
MSTSIMPELHPSSLEPQAFPKHDNFTSFAVFQKSVHEKCSRMLISLSSFYKILDEKSRRAKNFSSRTLPCQNRIDNGKRD